MGPIYNRMRVVLPQRQHIGRSPLIPLRGSLTVDKQHDSRLGKCRVRHARHTARMVLLTEGCRFTAPRVVIKMHVFGM